MTYFRFSRPMRPAVFFLTLLAAAVRSPAAGNLLPEPGAKEWTSWSVQRLSPPHFAVEAPDRPGDGKTLSLHLDRHAAYGRWTALVSPVKPGQFYEFSVRQRTSGVDFDNVRVPLILSWFGTEDGKRMIERDEVDQTSPQADDGWTRRYRRLRAPEGAKSVRVELGLRWAANGTVRWRDLVLREAPAPSPRKVRIVTTSIAPPANPSVDSNTALMAAMFDRVAEQRPDIVLFSEALADRGVNAPLEERAQPIPGPLTRMLSERARRHHTYVATSLHEVDKDGHFYNTAVLIGRDGQIAGTYRKVHLTMEEADEGLLPGNRYPVFETDFGRVGIMICWDNWFPEAARLLKLHGAEIILLPIAGDGVPGHWQPVSKARALDNGVYLVSSATSTAGSPSCIIDPAGNLMVTATGGFDEAMAEIDLNREWRVPYLSVGSGLGEAGSLYRQERRPDTYQSIATP